MQNKAGATILFNRKLSGIEFFNFYLTLWSTTQSKKHSLTPTEIKALANIIMDNSSFYGNGRARAARRLRTSYNSYSVILHNLVKKGMLVRVQEGYALPGHLQSVVDSYLNNDILNISFEIDTSTNQR